jgi:undecaprenyl-diphosphatase
MNTFLQRVHLLDTNTFLWLHVTKKFQYRPYIRWISHTGDGHFYFMIALSLLLLDSNNGTEFFWSGIIAYVIEVSLYLLLKNAIKRDRPAIKISSYTAWITPSDQFSFPSGHTAAAFVFACLVLHFYPTFAVLAFIWAAAIASSRVLLGVHYPTDLVAGALLGSGCALWGTHLYSLIQ